MKTLTLTTAEFRAVREALAAFVENGNCRDDVDDPHAADESLAPAEAIMARLDAWTAAQAEEPPTSAGAPDHLLFRSMGSDDDRCANCHAARDTHINGRCP